VPPVLQGCAERGQLHGTTCQRLLLASLLSMTGNVMSLCKVSAMLSNSAAYSSGHAQQSCRSTRVDVALLLCLVHSQHHA
jgi:hypothetical protein